MLTAMSVTGTYAPSVTFVLSDADANGIGVQRFAWRPVMWGDPIKTPDTSGSADTYVQVAHMEIEVAGKIIGSTAANYWTRRNAFVDAILPDQGSQGSTYRHGQLFATFTGQSQVYADFVTVDFEAPLEVLSPSDGQVLSEYVWKARNPYGFWRAVSGGAVLKV